MNIRAAVFFIAIGFLAPSHASEPPRNADSLVPGDIVSGPIRYGRRVIGIPSGQWRVFAKRERSVLAEATDPRVLTLWFDEISNGRLVRTLEVSASNYSGNFEWFAEPCKSKGDSYLIKDEKTSLNNQFCTRVGFKSNMVIGASGEQFDVWARDLIRVGIDYPREMPFVRVTRYTRSDYMHMTMSFDPMASGIGDSKHSERTLNDWNASGPPSSQQHVRFYEALATWSPIFAKAVVRAFEGDATLIGASFGNPSLPTK